MKLCFDNFCFEELDKASIIAEDHWDFDDVNQLYQRIKDVQDHFSVFMGSTAEMPNFLQNVACQVERTIGMCIKQLKTVAQKQFDQWDLDSILKRRAKKWIVYEGEENE